MRGFLSRDRKKSKETEDAITATPVVPKVLKQRVNRRLEQIAVEQENEKLPLGGSEDSENSLLQSNQTLSASDNDDSVEGNGDSGGGGGGFGGASEIFRTTIAASLKEAANQTAREDSARLLYSIASDMSDASTAYFEETDESSSNSSYDYSPRQVKDAVALSTSLLGLEMKNENGQERDVSPVVITSRRQLTDKKSQPIVDDMIAPTSLFPHQHTTSEPALSSKPPLHQKLLPSLLLFLLSGCLIWQLIFFPMQWMAWLATSLSIICASLLWPKVKTVVSASDQAESLRLRHQELLAEGLPYKSRLLVAQNNFYRLQQRIKKLKKLKQLCADLREGQQRDALMLTIQVLLKSNRTPETTHVNALTLSVLPVKLASIGVKVQVPQLMSLAQSKRGSRYILLNLFRELLADESDMFEYPPLFKKSKNKKSSSKMSKILGSGEAPSGKKRPSPQRIAVI